MTSVLNIKTVTKRGNIVARRADTKVSEDFQKHLLCPEQMLRVWQNERTFGKHDHVSSLPQLCPRFAGA